MALGQFKPEASTGFMPPGAESRMPLLRPTASNFLLQTIESYSQTHLFTTTICIQMRVYNHTQGLHDSTPLIRSKTPTALPPCQHPLPLLRCLRALPFYRAYLQEHQFETQYMYLAFKRMSRLPLSLNSITIKYVGEEKGSSTNVLQAILLNISASGHQPSSGDNKKNY